jgi:hypothetical protein
MDTDRESELADEWAEAVAAAGHDPAILDAIGTLTELRRLGVVMQGPTYRLTSPYGSGMGHLAHD